MIDVSHKPTSLRTATARAVLHASPATITRLQKGQVPKGDPFEVARAATAMAVKQTPLLIPYCHPLRIDWVNTEFTVGPESVTVDVTVKAVDRTGVEVEAMTGASLAALVLYDMLKMLDDELWIEGVRLLVKHGGKSDRHDSDPALVTAAVLVASDSIAAGRKQDLSGLLIRERLEGEDFQVVDYLVVPDEVEAISRALCHWADERGIQLIVTTGGTGFGPRDRTPEAMNAVIEREAPGIMEAIRLHGQQRTARSMLARGRAGIRGRTLVVNLPGSKAAVATALDAMLPDLRHAFAMLQGEGHQDDPRPG